MDGEKEQHYHMIKLKIEAANQYVKETENEIPSIEESDVTSANNVEIVVLRKSNIIVAEYQHIGNYNFFRMDSKE